MKELPRQMFTPQTRWNIGYGTLTGLLIFLIIVICCWFLRERLERQKLLAKAQELENMKKTKDSKNEEF